MNTRFSFVRTASLAFLLALAVTVPVAEAQGTRSLARATVPFAFQYGARAFPAGKYTFGMISDSILVVHGRNRAALAMVEWTEDSNQAQTGKLVFHREGDRYVLRDIWVPELSAHVRCPQARQHKHPEMATVAKPAAPPEVEVALLESPR